MGTRRSYKQLCGLAAALDVVGERWTMLLVRDLSPGPLRYGELLEGLPGIGEGLLVQRLRHLEAEGIVRRAFSSEQNAVVYELTEDGEALWAALVPLMQWGVRHIEPLIEDDVRADWLVVALRARLDPSQAVGLSERYAFVVDGEPFTIAARHGEVTVERGEPDDAVVRVEIDLETLLAVGAGAMTIAQARDAGRTRVSGDPEAVARYNRILRPSRV